MIFSRPGLFSDSFPARRFLVLAALVAYCNSYSGPFIYDDLRAIVGNPSIRHLGQVLSSPPKAFTAGRPLINLTFALNYAWSGLNVRSYHVVNLLVHALAGLTLFGLVRRTLLRPAMAGLRRAGPPAPSPEAGLYVVDATPLALAVALIWVVHPLQTEAVTYISQRAESLMGLFYLLTLYCFVRSAERWSREPRVESQEPDPSVAGIGSQRSTLSSRLGSSASGIWPLASALWLLASVLSCLLGALTKEVIVTAPVMVFLYDRTFVAGSFREAWRRRWRYYLGLAATWILLAGLRTSVNQRGVGFGYGMTAWDYALTSCRSLVRYLELAFWPHPLVFDYSVDGVRRMATVWPFVLVLSLLVAGVAIALQRRAAIGFAGAWFFLILAPTSSFVPIAGQPMAEHRMYLPLAGVIALAVFGLYRWGGRRSLILWAVLSVGLGCLTVRRNEDYRSALAIWSDTAAKQPRNARANNNLGLILADLPGRLTEAIYRYETALRIDPYFAEAHNNLGLALSHVPGHLAEAIAHYNAALRIDPHSAEAHNNLGLALSHVPGHLAEAIAHYQTALCLQPDLAEAHNNLGLALAQFPGRRSEAIAHFEAALLIDPNFAVAHNNLGVALSAEPGRLAEAISQFAAALRIDPDLLPARQMLDKLRATPPQAGQK